jgi:raffinose/stachyose/melibiose transport system permease protein
MSAIRFRVLPRQQTQLLADKQQRQLNKTLLVLLFLLPGMAIFAFFLLIPIARSAHFSFYHWDGFGPLTDYVGFGNYERLLNQKIFQNTLQHSFIIMILSLMVQLPLALSLALIVGRGKLRGKKVFRTILFVPYVFSEVITALIWMYVLHPTDGLVNSVLGGILPNYNPIGWYGDRSLVLYSVFMVITWKYFGFHMILYMAGLQSIPKDLEEAARVDGATERQVLTHITLPLLGSTIRLTIFLSVLGSFQQFVMVWILTGGGPVNSSELIATYLYKYGISRNSFGYGSAVAVILFSITFLFSIGYQRLIMRQDYSLKR